MNDNFENYLKELGINGDLYRKVERVISFYNQVLENNDLLDLYITDIINQDGSRSYVNLWLFYKGFIVEAKNFNTRDDFDCIPLKLNKINYWRIEKTNFDIIDSPKEDSRMKLLVSWRTGVSCELFGTKSNCKYLFAIFQKYFQKQF